MVITFLDGALPTFVLQEGNLDMLYRHLFPRHIVVDSLDHIDEQTGIGMNNKNQGGRVD